MIRNELVCECIHISSSFLFFALQKDNKKAQYYATALQNTPRKWMGVQSVRQFMVTQIKQSNCSFYALDLNSYRTTDINSLLLS